MLLQLLSYVTPLCLRSYFEVISFAWYCHVAAVLTEAVRHQSHEFAVYLLELDIMVYGIVSLCHVAVLTLQEHH